MPLKRTALLYLTGLLVGTILLSSSTFAQGRLGPNRIDTVRPDAPELASYGDRTIGVRTLEVSNEDEIDLLALEKQKAKTTESSGEQGGEAGKDLPRYDRPLTLEVWYPAKPGGAPTPYEVFLRDGTTNVEILGRATRTAAPELDGAPYPLVIVSHGYPGNRFLLSHLAENLASKGYVVVSIDHTDSTYRTRAAFTSTLVNRSLDQLFVLDEITRLAAERDHFLSGLVDTGTTGLIGYSMGGYGAVITSGGGVTDQAVEEGAPAGTLGIHRAGSSEHKEHFDPRIKAIVSFAPWGLEAGLWDATGLAGIRIPTLFIAGSADDVSGYETGTRAIFEQAINVDRALLTFENASHNAAAPMPAPAETFGPEGAAAASFSHYADSVWDTVRMNNIAQHFVTAYFGKLLKRDSSMAPYLDLVPNSRDGVWSVEADGTPRPEHTYWKGFQNRTATGLRFETLSAAHN